MALLFVATACVGLRIYEQFESNQMKLKSLADKAAWRKGQQRELEEKTRILLQAKRFVDRARSLGLEPQQWSVYSVSIEEPLKFAEVEQILNQCANSAAAYYLPATLHIKTIASNQSPSVTTKSAARPRADLLVTLKGKFLARPE